MTKTEITQGVKQVLSQNSRYILDEINLSDPLDKFISSSFKDRLGREVKRKFEKIKTTQLTNALYESIKKVNQLIDYIDKIYNPIPV